MFTFDKLELPRLGLRGLEAGLTEEEQAIQDATHRFAEDDPHLVAVRRPGCTHQGRRRVVHREHSRGGGVGDGEGEGTG